MAVEAALNDRWTICELVRWNFRFVGTMLLRCWLCLDLFFALNQCILKALLLASLPILRGRVRNMTEKTETKPVKPADAIATEAGDGAASWQHAQQNYLSTATAMSAEWCHFMAQRFEAYAHVVDDMSRCHDFNEAWWLQSDFGAKTFKAYTDEAAKLCGLIDQTTQGGPTKPAH